MLNLAKTLSFKYYSRVKCVNLNNDTINLIAYPQGLVVEVKGQVLKLSGFYYPSYQNGMIM